MAFRRTDTDVSTIPEGGPLTRWARGVGAPALVCLFGLSYIIDPHGGADGGAGLAARGSVFVGVGILWLALFLHFRYFWGLSERLCRYCEILQGISIIGLLATPVVYVAVVWLAR